MRNMPFFRNGFKKPAYPLVAVLLVILFACGTSQISWSGNPSPVHHLVILHTNDSHGHPLKFSFNSAPGVGGLPARATLIRQIREENENVLVLDAGDLNTGRPESNLFKAEPDIKGYNYIGYDAMALGNHEFDHPLEVLKKQIEQAHFPFLSANIKTGNGEYLTRRYLIKEIDGLRVAIFGLTTKTTHSIGNPKNILDLVFEDEIEVAGKLVPELRRKADLVIALVHMGIYQSSFWGSKRLASEVKGIDLVVDGHTHTRLDHPIIIENSGSDHKTIIVQAWKWGLLLGRVDLRVRDKRIIDFKFEAIPMNLKRVEKKANGTRVYHPVGKEIKEDEVLLNLLRPYAEAVRSSLSEVIGYAEGTFSNRESREGETALGDMVADSMLWYTKRLGADFAIQNGGGIRADLPEGQITKGTIHEILPFDNSVVLLTLRGSDVQSLFDHIGSVSGGGGAFPQISKGVSFTIDRARRRCVKIRIHGHPIDPTRTYKIATNSYLANGGNGYKIFLRAMNRYESSAFQRYVFIEYVKSLGGRIRPVMRKRIQIKPEHRVYEPFEPSSDPYDHFKTASNG